DPRGRRYRTDRAWASGVDHHRGLGAWRAYRESDGTGRCLARVVEPDAHHPRAGTYLARAWLCGSGAAEWYEWSGDHPARDDAEPVALSRCYAGERSVRCNSGIG